MVSHGGFIARKESKWVRLYSRPGNDLTYRFPLIVQALTQLRAGSCIIDGRSAKLANWQSPSRNATST
jgi:ATP-dependent DNA ligase